MLIFDIETEPLPLDELRAILPPFDESAVACGNLKDPEKIAAKIAAAKQEYEIDFIDRAALSAITGRVLVIGCYNVERDIVTILDGSNDDGDAPEAKLLRDFWRLVGKCQAAKKPMVGLNIIDFDLPFLMRRSWINQVAVPSGIIRGRYFCDTFVDLRQVWLCGQQANGTKSNFDTIAKALGTPGKPEGVNGGDFAKLWREDREKAIAYLEGDLRQPAEWAKRMGIV